MLEFLYEFRTSLMEHTKTTSDAIKLPLKMIKRLEHMKEGNHIYLTLKYLDRYEVVKYTHQGQLRNGFVPVERDILGSGRKNFPCGSCVVADWNPIQLNEFICQVKNSCQDVGNTL